MRIGTRPCEENARLAANNIVQIRINSARPLRTLHFNWVRGASRFEYAYVRRSGNMGFGSALKDGPGIYFKALETVDVIASECPVQPFF